MAFEMSRWNWRQFRGSDEALKWARRDLEHLDLAMRLTPGRTAAVQAGGNLGVFPKYLAREFQTVYTFEPAPDLFAAMAVNAPESNIVRFQAALGCDRELVGLSRIRRDGKPTNHEGITHVSGPGVFPTLRVDDLGLPVCDLLYLDIEGYEWFALRGAVQTIERCRPVLGIEINKHLAENGLSADDMRRWIVSLGYRLAKSIRSDEIYVPEGRS